MTRVVIIGGGIGGLTLALALHQVGLRPCVFEAVPDFKPLGVGINLLPHAMRQFDDLGLGQRIAKRGVETRELCFFTKHGQIVDRESRGRHAGYNWPQVSIHRAALQDVLFSAVCERLGSDSINFGHQCVSVSQNEKSANAHFDNGSEACGDLLVACDGIHSVLRRQIHPAEPPLRFESTTQWRGVTRWKSFLTDASMIYVGTYESGKLVAYPIQTNIDGEGRCLVNWAVELSRPTNQERNWNRVGNISDFVHCFDQWRFEWLDIPAMLRAADVVLEYPVFDQDALPFWTNNRVTLLGDAAHPMTPRGSNGAAQAIIDAMTLSGLLKLRSDPRAALKEYEAIRLAATSKVVVMNRSEYPDAILRRVNERTGGARFRHIDDVISESERREWQARYKSTAGFNRDHLNKQVSLLHAPVES